MDHRQIACLVIFSVAVLALFGASLTVLILQYLKLVNEVQGECIITNCVIVSNVTYNSGQAWADLNLTFHIEISNVTYLGSILEYGILQECQYLPYMRFCYYDSRQFPYTFSFESVSDQHHILLFAFLFALSVILVAGTTYICQKRNEYQEIL